MRPDTWLSATIHGRGCTPGYGWSPAAAGPTMGLLRAYALAPRSPAADGADEPATKHEPEAPPPGEGAGRALLPGTAGGLLHRQRTASDLLRGTRGADEPTRPEHE